MPTPFAALEARVNAAACARLANASADFGGGVVVDGIFDNAYAAADLMSGAEPAFQAPSASLSGVARGTALTINGTAYLVRIREDDGTGWTVLRLEKA